MRKSEDMSNKINYEVFQHKREELKAIQRKRERDRRIKITCAVIALFFLLVMVSIIQQSRCDYYSYKEEIKTEDNVSVNYETFGDGYIKYSGNGIEYQKEFGVAKWNIALSFSKPFLSKNDQYILIGDRGGNKAILFDINGKVNEFIMRYPIVQLCVSENGNIEVILEGDECSYVEVYTKQGEKIAETKNTLKETGYPLTAALSPDGTQLAISYYTIDELKGGARIAFYDFNKQIQMDNIPLKGGFDYEDQIIPKIQFLSNDRAVAFGDNTTYYYDISDDPKELETIEFSEKIESIFTGKKYFGYVCNNDDPEKEGRYRICLFDKKGKQKMDTTLDMNYQNVFMVKDEIFATKENECTILNKNGKILFQGTLEGSNIENVLPCPGWRTYRVIFGNKIVKMKLSFME